MNEGRSRGSPLIIVTIGAVVRGFCVPESTIFLYEKVSLLRSRQSAWQAIHSYFYSYYDFGRAFSENFK